MNIMISSNRLALAALLAFGVPALPVAAQAASLTISVYGFGQDKFQKILYTPFEQQCDCQLVVETGNSIERLAKMEEHKGNPVVDLAVMAHFDALAAERKGLLTKIDSSKLSNYSKLYGFAKDPLGNGKAIGYTFYSTSIVYRKDKVSIESWADLLDPELAGRVAFPNISTTQASPALFMLGKALGNDASSFKTPIKAIADKRDNFVTFYERSSSLLQLMQQDEIWAAPVGRFVWSRIATLDVPFAWAEPQEGQSGGLNVMVLTAGSPNTDLAHRFMDFWLSTPIQTALANALVDSPVNMEVKVAADIAANLSFGQETADSLLLVEPEIIVDNREAWVENWNNTVIR